MLRVMTETPFLIEVVSGHVGLLSFLGACGRINLF
jgi:hypothetical protein